VSKDSNIKAVATRPLLIFIIRTLTDEKVEHTLEKIASKRQMGVNL
jgi:uncharacterized membrane protein